MTDERSGATGQTTQDQTLWKDLGWLIAALRTSPTRHRVYWVSLGIVIVLIGNILMQVELNRWNGQFFDSLSARELSAFLRLTGLFLLIMAGLLTLVVAQTLLQELLKLELRRFLTVHIADLWLMRARPYRLAFAGTIGANPDQRVQEDTRKLAEFTAELAIGLVQQIFLLTTFISVLWSLSSALTFMVGATSVSIPGYMVWCALLYAGLGSLVAFLVGQPLVRLNADRSQREAELRFALVRLTESAESIGFLRGEDDERRALNQPIDNVLGVLRAIAFKLARLTWVTSGYGWLSLIVPVLVAAPTYFAGVLTFGGLMRQVDAFTQVQASLRWLVDNVAKIADWRAALYRVMRFEEELRRATAADASLEGIVLARADTGCLDVRDVTIRLPGGAPIVQNVSFSIAPGERVQLAGPAGSGKSTLLRAMAGLWPWGSGTIRLPAPEEMMFLPARPYLPLGTLRDAITYPSPPERFNDDLVRLVMARCGLECWAGQLDTHARWDRDLTIGEQQRLTFARLILHRPSLIIMDEATAALDEQGQIDMIGMFEAELKDAALLLISHRGGFEALATRHLRLEAAPGGSRLREVA